MSIGDKYYTFVAFLKVKYSAQINATLWSGVASLASRTKRLAMAREMTLAAGLMQLTPASRQCLPGKP